MDNSKPLKITIPLNKIILDIYAIYKTLKNCNCSYAPKEFFKYHEYGKTNIDKTKLVFGEQILACL